MKTMNDKENIDDLMNQAFNKVGTEQFENENYTKLVKIITQQEDMDKRILQLFHELKYLYEGLEIKYNRLKKRIEGIASEYVSKESINNELKTMKEHINYLSDIGRT
jgi:predicted RNase H-like nuclease (RuvC/YqgF family)